jgi:hypothetical protein
MLIKTGKSYYSSRMEALLRSWLRRCATNQNVAGSNPDDVVEFFQFAKYFQRQYGP